jgi:hypothetical protein
MTEAGLAAKAGAALFLLWSVLHIWVGAEGLRVFFGSNIPANQWDMVIGGANCPKSAFQLPKDILPKNQKDFSSYPGGIGPTAYAQSHLILNFCLDVGGYGVMGVLVAYMIYARASWLFFLMGAVLIGIADLSFMFLMVWPGQVIELNAGTVGGPVLWILAMIITPFGLGPFSLDELKPLVAAGKKKA